MCKTTYENHLNSNDSCCDIYLYKTNINNLDNSNNKISLFKLYGIIGYQFLCYYITKEFRLEQVKLEKEKSLKKSLFDKIASATT